VALIVSTWLWGSSYPQHYVERLAAGLFRNLKQEHRFVVFHPQEEDRYLTEIPGCFARLRMFDPSWQAAHDIKSDDRLVCLDLDTVLTGPLDPLFDRPEPFLILQDANLNPCRFNGSLMMLRPGAHPEVWTDFTLEKAKKVPFYQFPDDQGWLWHKVPRAAGWKAGSSSGCYVFMKPGWPQGQAGLPKGARYVTFAGWRDPSKFLHLDWVKNHWLT
jgi:hypothetical protein